MSSAFQFCPRCATALIPREQGGFVRHSCPNQACGYVHWDNPTPVVAAVVEHDGAIVLARNALWPTRFFGLITGFLERNEDPAEAVLREVNEELGLQAHSPSFIGHYTFERMNQLIIAYHVIGEGEIVLNEELSEFKRIAPASARYWPAATGLALRDWLLAQGHDPQPMELPTRS
ncbi:NUDIX domain-containing protein [Sinimarinibacterium sp. CAU 1509]|uniref:NUDIX domain-containing protein n=1 Tax=Sinimarinibacterium sp. CAU 1509 TaxID=2562283 RepID=UPI0010ABCB28|nr:NUDIX domain-containing protein [Sinimarinibacterium sp. CAU 1509]TJY58219.1 NUDIX domain-containing protein [Sinimarinibacterium sp. CAU 1509]